MTLKGQAKLNGTVLDVPDSDVGPGAEGHGCAAYGALLVHGSAPASSADRLDSVLAA